MPASSSETRNRWRKRKRGEQSRKPRPQPQHHHDEDEEDYEEEDDVDLDQQNPHPEFDDDLSNSSDPTAATGAESEVISDGAVRISTFPSVIKQTVNQHHYSVIQIVARERACQTGDSSSGGMNCPFLENISHGQLQALSAMPRDAPALTGGDSEGSFVITPPPIMEGRGVIKRYGSNRVHVVPMHADWFSPTTVNRLERQAVPHFFSGKSMDHTPEKYMDCRNRIVAKYMENPARRLSTSDCQAFLVGVDADDVTRVVRFLENWGVINYCAAPLNNHDPRNEGSYLTEDLKGELRVPATALRSIDSLIQFDKPRCRIKAADIYPELAVDSDENSDLDSRIRELLSENRCNHCSISLGIVYYQSLKEIETLLCLNCFNEGAFVAGHSSLDFIKVDSTKYYGDLEADSWTNQETLLLLEGMELFNENWIEIAEHVGTKSKAQCILHFVRLSIDETPLESIEVPAASNLPNGNGCGKPQSYANGKASIIEDPEFEDRLPFEKSGNPVMSQVAFLASAVGPRVAAACAHASLAALSEDDHLGASENAGVVDGSVSENRMNSETINGRDDCTRADTRNPVQQKVEISGVQGARSQGDANVTCISSEKMRNAVRAGLAAAATKAKLFADHEEREIQRLSANIINHQLKRLELKLKQFAEVESLLIKECEQLERARQRVSAERGLLLSSQFGPGGGVTRPTGLPGVGPSLVNNAAAGSSRQQGSPAQPFISGFPSNHPQQPMFGLGPRLPLSAINPSSSSAASPHPMLRPVSGSRSGFE
ncbi:SWI/SNF complex subunit SWI3C isoform X1 [Cynara cardunculus var. scolymus]|uniref:SWI/SNF complex subunit SWI3C isoform X1 n=1 Tax=Cynara cardunculus var. scolymus TaxID=59895 RepID=UPI000D62CEC0|nr:SWI/SNF complex subunit SWI3C isoform X1 [Cynara cardunculus var. scolymus]